MTNGVIPAKAGIQLAKSPHASGMAVGFVRYAEWMFWLDSGFRRITSDLPASGLSRVASSLINDGLAASVARMK